MDEQSLKPVIENLEDLFSKFNKKFYNNELQKPIISVSPDTTRGAYGWCTTWRAWSNREKVTDLAKIMSEGIGAIRDEGFYEINMCTEHLSRPLANIASTLLHEMVHLYNLQIEVQDACRRGTYHNKKFKEAAERHGLTIQRDEVFGWAITSLNDEAQKYIETLEHQQFQLFRRDLRKTKMASRQSTRKYVCPICGCIIRATRKVDVICAKCCTQFVEV